jgi:hypothetical protein
MIDQIVLHADVLTLKGASYRLRGCGSTASPASEPKTRHTDSTNRGLIFAAATASDSNVAESALSLDSAEGPSTLAPPLKLALNAFCITSRSIPRPPSCIN